MSEQGWGCYPEAARVNGIGDLWDSGGYSEDHTPNHLPGGGAYVKDAPSGLRVRSEPSTSSETLIIMPNGAYLTVLDQRSDGWAEVEYQGTHGFSSLQYIDLTGHRAGYAPDPNVAPSPPFTPPNPSPSPPDPTPPAPPPAPAKKSNTKLLLGAAAAAVLGYFFFG